MNFGLLGDYDALPDIGRVAEGIEAALAELVLARPRPGAAQRGRARARSASDQRATRASRPRGARSRLPAPSTADRVEGVARARRAAGRGARSAAVSATRRSGPPSTERHSSTRATPEPRRPAGPGPRAQRSAQRARAACARPGARTFETGARRSMVARAGQRGAGVEDPPAQVGRPAGPAGGARSA